MKFPNLPTKPNLPKEEMHILEFWKQNDIYNKIQEASKDKKPFVFLEGPPTANGHPHMGHALTRAIKDIYLRYKTMTGHYVTPRIGGWDCHGLPVEIEVEKELGLESKEDIIEYGIDKFITKCPESVMRYVKEWEELSERIGFHLDLSKSYITMSEDYIESVWWSLKQIYDKKLLFKGYKVVPYCTRCGTPISSHEVAQGYQETQDPSIFIKFKLKGETNKYALAWTTTPWTLLSNLVLAVNKEAAYIEVDHEGEILIFAKELLPRVFHEKKDILKEYPGETLLDLEYEALFPYTANKKTGKAHFIVAADFVSMEEGTGIVHCAPAFGVEDYELCQAIGVDMLNPVRENGTFDPDMPDFGGLHVKKADPLIINKLEEENKLLRVEEITHTYPFCWRCDSPLLYYAMESWFIGMSQVRDRIRELNQQIRWQPKHLKDGRFGNFLDELKDWSLSRSRYWGTPLPIWTCKKGHEFIVGSRKELHNLTKGGLPKGFSLHKPDVDKIQVTCPKCKSLAKREEYVIDCWYDSGSAPFAQWHYPFENKEEFEKHFPIDFITEAIDQTRGWFYSLLAISTVVFDKPAYLTCLTMGHVQDEDGKKMSKSKGNYSDPQHIFSEYGADPSRWLLFSTPTWNDVRFGDNLVEESLKEFILPLWNVLSFFVTYANLDNYSPELKKYQIAPSKRPLLDQWILSRYNTTLKEIEQGYDDLSIHFAIKALKNFLNADLSNLWIRQSRRRFWEKKLTVSKKSAYSTLYEILESLSKVIAPILPFLSEKIYQDLVVSQGHGKLSVHLETYPHVNEQAIKPELESLVSISRDAITTGRAIRARKDFKARWPLPQVIFVTNSQGKEALIAFKDLLLQELNVKEMLFSDNPVEFQEISFAPNFKQLGPKFKKNANDVASWMRGQKGQTAKDIAEILNANGTLEIEINGQIVTISKEDLEIRITEREGYSGASFTHGDLFLNMNPSEELLQEGFVRDLIRRIQSMRKDMELAYDDEICVGISNITNETQEMIQRYLNLIKEEVLALSLDFSTVKGFTKNWVIQDPYSKTRELTISINNVKNK
ncbi:MAG: isoleucine--tRNA ligase [Candidatus Heimdallarchaeota archaeon]|nr:isoleucine--tRNA ligase [Candidatus Heimdallarchaeota archaeon]